MFASDRLQRLVQNANVIESPPPPPPVEPVSSASPPSGAESDRSGRGRGRGRGRGEGRPQTARPATSDATAGDDSVPSGRRGASNGGRGGRGRGGRGAAPQEDGEATPSEAGSDAGRGRGRDRGRGGRARGAEPADGTDETDVPSGESTAGRGGRGGRGGDRAPEGAASAGRSARKKKGDRPASAAHATADPDVAAASLDDALAPAAAVPAPAPAGPSRKALAKAQAKAQAQAKAEAKARAEAAKALAIETALNDPLLPTNIPSAPLTTELAQVSRRYHASFTRTQTRSTIVCAFSFTPSDPDFPFALPPEQVQVQFTFYDISTYPYVAFPPRTPPLSRETMLERVQRHVCVSILNRDADIPAFMREAVETSLHYFLATTQLGQPQMVRAALKLLDKDLSDWLRLAQNRHEAKQRQTIARLTGAVAKIAIAKPEEEEGGDEKEEEASEPQEGAASAADDTTSPAAAAASSAPPLEESPPIRSEPGDFDAIEEDIWSAAQQSALESGLRDVPRTLPASERWDQIAARVEGKTRKQVLVRFKQIRDAVKNHTVEEVRTVSNDAAAAPTPAASSSSSALGFGLPRFAAAQEVDPDEQARVHAARVREQQIEREADAQRAAEAAEAEAARRLAMKGQKQPRQPKKSKEQREAEKAEKVAAAEREEEEGEDGESDDEVPEFTPVTERISLNPAHRGTQLLVDDLEMSGVGIIKSSVLRAQLLCVRCETRVELEFLPSNGVSHPACTRCPRCGITLSLAYRPEMVHAHSDSLGYADLQNGELFDMMPSDFFATCLECFTEHPIKSLQRGQRVEDNCRSCHTRLTCCVGQFSFERITPATVDYDAHEKVDTRGRKAAAAIDPQQLLAAKNRSKEQALLRLGTTLPNKGSCRHYKHSYRWMRFPCCGKAYPCDNCHNEAEDHSGVWATRMICGACSKEQPFSSKPCTHCGLAFSTVAKTFWEGGQGMRDRTRLSRNDSKKHSGLGKTQSMKSARVGQKGRDTNKQTKKETGNNTN